MVGEHGATSVSRPLAYLRSRKPTQATRVDRRQGAAAPKPCSTICQCLPAVAMLPARAAIIGRTVPPALASGRRHGASARGQCHGDSAGISLGWADR